MVQIIHEKPEHRAEVFEVNLGAFGRPDEARLVDALRPVAGFFISLVAIVEGRVAGHILFTEVTVRGENGLKSAVGLAPMAVLPEFQNRGIGSRLVLAGLDACRNADQFAVFVLGEPEYYGRFGFINAASLGIYYKSGEFAPYFMAAELKPCALDGMSGFVEYLAPFDRIS